NKIYTLSLHDALPILLKIYNNNKNMASETLKDKKFHQLDINGKSEFNIILSKFLNESNIQLTTGIPLFKINPWFDLGDKVDLSRSEEHTSELQSRSDL